MRILNKYWLQISILTVFVILTSLFFPTGKSLQFVYKLDDIAREPVIAPFTFPILKTEEKLQADLNEALRSEPFVFFRDQEIVEFWAEKTKEFFLLLTKIRSTSEQLKQSEDLVYRYRYEPQYAIAKAEFTADSTSLSLSLEKLKKNYPFPTEQDLWKSFIFKENSYRDSDKSTFLFAGDWWPMTLVLNQIYI